jgi:hypothetical protein
VRCRECSTVIPVGRLEALPDTETCVACSNVKPRSIEDVDVCYGDYAVDSEYTPEPVGVRMARRG